MGKSNSFATENYAIHTEKQETIEQFDKITFYNIVNND